MTESSPPSLCRSSGYSMHWFKQARVAVTLTPGFIYNLKQTSKQTKKTKNKENKKQRKIELAVLVRQHKRILIDINI
jgi:hypothetical protein